MRTYLVLPPSWTIYRILLCSSPFSFCALQLTFAFPPSLQVYALCGSLRFFTRHFYAAKHFILLARFVVVSFRWLCVLCVNARIRYVFTARFAYVPLPFLFTTLPLRLLPTVLPRYLPATACHCLATLPFYLRAVLTFTFILVYYYCRFGWFLTLRYRAAFTHYYSTGSLLVLHTYAFYARAFILLLTRTATT